MFAVHVITFVMGNWSMYITRLLHSFEVSFPSFLVASGLLFYFIFSTGDWTQGQWGLNHWVISFLFFETESGEVAQTGLNLWSSCLYSQVAGITGLHDQIWLHLSSKWPWCLDGCSCPLFLATWIGHGFHLNMVPAASLVHTTMWLLLWAFAVNNQSLSRCFKAIFFFFFYYYQCVHNYSTVNKAKLQDGFNTLT